MTTSASGADGVEQAALLGDRAGDAALVAERVAVARLARSGGSGPRRAPRGRTTCGRIPRPSSAPRIAAERERRVAGPHVEHDRDLGEALAVGRDELGKVGQQLAGQVVDDGVAEVLEQLRRGGLAAAGQAADDAIDGRARSRGIVGVERGRRSAAPRRSPAACAG